MQRVTRLEDDDLVRGRGRYLADLDLPGILHAVFVRSPIAHGDLGDVRVDAARRAPGVVAVLVAGDLDLGRLRSHPLLPTEHDRPPLAIDRVRHVGEPIAVVVAETPAAAVDAAELVDLDLTPRPPIVDLDEALAADGPAFERVTGHADEVLADAATVVRHRFWNQRVAPAPMEPDGVLAVPDPDRLIVWASTQTVHKLRDAIAAGLGLDPAHVRVRAPLVGGGFGGKFEPAPEAIVVAATARRLGRPVRWVQTRTENLLGMPHGRAMRQDVALGLGADGEITGIWAELIGDAGGHPMIGALMPNATLLMLPGTYRVQRAGGVGRSVSTTTTPLGAYRGAGRPEACALVERAIDLAARRLGVDPVELRRRNLVPADGFPHTSATGMIHDSGDYRACLDAVVERLDVDALRADQAARRAAGDETLLGIGIAMWIDCTPMNRPGEHARVELCVDRGGGVRATVWDGANDQGQAHRTTWALLLGAELGLPLDAVDLALGDTAEVPHGLGTGSARSLMLAGGAVAQAGRELLDEGRSGRRRPVGGGARRHRGHRRRRAGRDRLPPARRRLGRGARRGGRGDERHRRLRAARSNVPRRLPRRGRRGRPETGAVTLRRFVAVDDCGVAVNPVVVEGQQHGGIAQGIGQALYEEVVHDADGTPLTTNLADYAVMSAAELPALEVDRIETPSPVNPLGAKGIGQAGAIGSTPAVQNAVVDALAHLGIEHLDLPLTPERVWRAIQLAR